MGVAKQTKAMGNSGKWPTPTLTSQTVQFLTDVVEIGRI